jgi:membrane dipeptidase
MQTLKPLTLKHRIVDLSHTSHGAQLQVLAQSEAPIIFSHASWYVLTTETIEEPSANICFTTDSYELCPNPRNVRDDVLHRLKANRGLIMICFIPSLITPMQTEHNVGSGGRDSGPSIISIADHIIYVGNLIGYSHVGIGSDFDGMLEGPPGLDDTSGFPALIEELVKRNVTDENIKLIMGLNVIRVMEEVEKVSRAALYVEKWEILCDEIENPWTEEQVSLLIERGYLRTRNSLENI